jgi:superfamily II DNA or RNA helicase
VTRTVSRTKPPSAKERRPATEPRLSRQRRPDDLSVEEWQTGLRRQFGREQPYHLEKLGPEHIFSDYAVTNPQTKGRYRVAIRGEAPGCNYCSCPDFATNDLGTCKHIEFTLERIRARRGGAAALRRGFTPRYSEIFVDYAGARSVRFRAGTDCPPALARRAGRLFDAADAGRLPRAYYARFDAFLKAAGRFDHELRVYDDALALIAAVRDGERRQRLLAEAYPRGARSARLKRLLKTKLYPYQAEGVLFAVRAGRCLIGDDMGLGKTVQALAAAELYARHFGVQRVLVVCPTSLKHQWHLEIGRFSGRLAQVIRGGYAARQKQFRGEGFCMITNFEALARDLDLIRAWSPELVIVDEAQRVKNWNTNAARSLKQIESPYAIVLTGTPLENRLEELLSIVQFIDRYRLGPTWRLLERHQVRDETGHVTGYRNLDRIGATLAPILLRRRKHEVLTQLPPRVDKNLFVPMTPEQRRHHDDNGETVRRLIARWRKTGYLSDADQLLLRCALQNMRMACDSTYLLDHETDHGLKADELATLLAELFERPDAKAVVFSQWLRTHELIIRRLERHGWGHVLFHGGVPADKRGDLVERFRRDADCRVFLSTDAGGVGLNLQHAAATVVNMDLPWNPAVLEQRIGRVHRLGQTRGVQVVNFIAQGTIEEGMLSLLAFKKSLFAGVLDGGDSEVFLHGTKLSRFLERIEQVTGAAAAASEEDDSEDGLPSLVPVPAAAAAAASDASPPPAPAAAGAPRSEAGDLQQAWAPLADAGLKLLQALAGTGGTRSGNGVSAAIEHDPAGRAYLKLPIPDPETVRAVADALKHLVAALHG